MEEKQGLSARELLESVYNLLRDDGKEIKLSEEALAEIANDSDWHRTRVGYTSYKTATLLKVGEKKWAVAFGTACGSYPADPYNCDIVAVRFSGDGKSDDEVTAEVYNTLEKNFYFLSSLVYAMADGQLAVNGDRCFSQKMLKCLRPRVQEFIAKNLEIDPHYLTMDLRPMVKSAIQYKSEFVVFLYNAIRAVLAL